MAHHVGISEYIDQGQCRRKVHTVDQELSPKVHASINPSARASYMGV